MLSWFVSPVLSGGMSVALYMLINRFILKTRNPLKSGLWSLPIFYGVTLFINLFSIIHDGPECNIMTVKIIRHINDIFFLFFTVLYLHNVPTWMALSISLGVSLVVAFLVQLFVVPAQRKKILGQSNGQPVKFTFGDSDGNCSITSLYSQQKKLMQFVYRFVSQQQSKTYKTSNVACL